MCFTCNDVSSFVKLLASFVSLKVILSFVYLYIYSRIDVFGTGTDVERFKMVASQTGNLLSTISFVKYQLFSMLGASLGHYHARKKTAFTILILLLRSLITVARI